MSGLKPTEIVPNLRVGDFELRRRIVDYDATLRDDYIQRGGVTTQFCFFADLYDVRYRLGDIELGVDVRTGRIYRVTVLTESGGRFGAVTVGQLVRDAIALDPRIYYDEAEGTLFVQGVNGIVLDVAADDPDPAVVPSLSLSAISVYAHEVVGV